MAETTSLYVAREADLDALKQHLNAARSGDSRAILLSAPMGGGKRALVGELARTALAEDDDVLLWRVTLTDEEDGLRSLLRIYGALFAALHRSPVFRGKVEMALNSQLPSQPKRVQDWYTAFIDGLKKGAPKDVRKRVRLGQLMLGRKHAEAAVVELSKGHEKLPRQALVRGLYARALVAVGKEPEAKALVEKVDDVPASDPTWWSMRGRLGVGDPAEAARTAVSRAPYDPPVACTELEAPSVPADPVLADLCRAARTKPQGD